MIELSSEYLRDLSEHLLMIATFLGGFSFAILGTLILSEKEGRLIKALILGLTIASSAFLLTIFACFDIIMSMHPENPFGVQMEKTLFPRVAGVISLLIGLIALIGVTGLSGWTKSKRLGIATTIVSVITLILSLRFMSS